MKYVVLTISTGKECWKHPVTYQIDHKTFEISMPHTTAKGSELMGLHL